MTVVSFSRLVRYQTEPGNGDRLQFDPNDERRLIRNTAKANKMEGNSRSADLEVWRVRNFRQSGIIRSHEITGGDLAANTGHRDPVIREPLQRTILAHTGS